MRQDLMIKSLNRSSSKGSKIAEICAVRIGRGEWPAGTELAPVPVEAGTFGVSAGPVTKARELMEVAGLITIRQGKPSVVTERGEWRQTEHVARVALREQSDYRASIRAFLEAEIRLECEAVRHGALGQDLSKITVLIAAQEAFRRVARGTRPEESDRTYDFADEVVHRAIIGLSDSPVDTAYGLVNHGVLVEEALHHPHTAADAEADIAEHDEIIAAIRAGYADRAERAVIAHLRGVATRRSQRGTWS
jgi:DNA-binding FadR family transcriptional regulator